jgi:hypothetical protein
MSGRVERVLYWSPRLLAMGFAAFLSVFALDAFDGSRDAAGAATAFAIHLAPTALVLVVLRLAWRRERTGALLFFALAVGYCVQAWGRFGGATIAIMAAPMVLIALLLLAHAALVSAARSR